jgi:predicted dehydrogenase
MRLKTILVGVGRRGRWAVEVTGADRKFQPVAVVDTSEDFLLSAQSELNLPAAASFSSLDEALQNVEADAVILCTPTSSHGPLSRLAFAAGKHVLVEKGMTYDWQEAQELVAQADAAGVCFCVAQNYRYNPIEQAITALLKDSAHPHFPGQVAIVTLISHRYRPDPRTLDYPYAMVWDMSCHHVDLLNAWIGSAKRVTAVSSNPPWSRYEYDADIAAVIEYENGANCQYVLNHAATYAESSLVLQGERGALRAASDGLHFYPLPEQQLGESSPINCAVPSLPRSEQGVADAFYRFIAEGVEPGISGRNNLKTLAVCEMLVRSARERRAVESQELN